MLPEGFNLGRRYRDPGPVELAPNLIHDLSKLAKDFPVVFVAGMILPDENDPTLRRNIAYLVDAAREVPLSRKITDDDSRNYDPVEDDDGLPVSYRGLTIGCLVCADCQSPSDERRARARYGRFVMALPSDAAVNCIPAHPHRLEMVGFEGRWREHFAVMASSCNEFSGSIVAIRGKVGAEEKADKEHPKNIVTVFENRLTRFDLLGPGAPTPTKWATSECSPNGSFHFREFAELYCKSIAYSRLGDRTPFLSLRTVALGDAETFVAGGAAVGKVASASATMEKMTVLAMQALHDNCPFVIIVEKPEMADYRLRLDRNGAIVRNNAIAVFNKAGEMIFVGSGLGMNKQMKHLCGTLAQQPVQPDKPESEVAK